MPCLAYSTAERVVGLAAWPLQPDGSMGLIAHPGDVLGLALSCDGRQLITLGAQAGDRTVVCVCVLVVVGGLRGGSQAVGVLS